MDKFAQIKSFIECFQEADMEWDCCFYTSLEVDGQVYDICLENYESYIRLTATFPNDVSDESIGDCKEQINRINENLDIGKFEFNRLKKRPEFCLYDMRRSDDDVIDKNAIRAMLQNCSNILAEYADSLYISPKRNGLEKLLSIIGFINESPADMEEDDIDE